MTRLRQLHGTWRRALRARPDRGDDRAVDLSPSPPGPSPAALRLAGAALAAASVLTASVAAHAARPMVTDDARIVDAKACQLESWVRADRDGGEEFWALPGCNPFGGFELTLGGASLAPEGGDRRVALQAQVKTLLRPLQPDDWGVGFAVGTLHTRASGASGAKREPYFYVPASLSIDGDRLFLHANLGAARLERGVSRDVRATWGVGIEAALTARLSLVAETYGVGGERAQAQLGLRAWIVPDRVQVDATVGHQGGPDGAGTWASIGLRLLSRPFLP